MCVCVRKMWQSRVVYLYIGVKLTGYQGRMSVKLESLEQTTRYWVGQDKQEECSWDRAVEGKPQFNPGLRP
jgi:hypothetical protein